MKKGKSTAPFDVRKVIRAAMEAALEEPASEVPVTKKKRFRSGRRVVLLGAGVYAGGRAVASGRGADVIKSLQDRVAGLGVDLRGKVPTEPNLDEEELVDAPAAAVDDLVGDESEPSEDVGSKRKKAKNGGAAQRRPQRQQRGRQPRARSSDH
jgi:hypothetical protein